MAGVERVELSSLVLETTDLPLNYTPMEPQMGIEPTPSPWQGDILTIILLRHI